MSETTTNGGIKIGVVIGSAIEPSGARATAIELGYNSESSQGKQALTAGVILGVVGMMGSYWWMIVLGIILAIHGWNRINRANATRDKLNADDMLKALGAGQ
jgi:hypothetical protein